MGQDLGYWFFQCFVRAIDITDSIDFLAVVENYRILTRDSLRADGVKKIVARFTKFALDLGNNRQATNHTSRNLDSLERTDNSILYRRGRTHRFACIRHMEKDDTIIGKVEEVLKSQSTNNIFLQDSTAVEVEGSIKVVLSGNETQEDPRRRSFVGISGNTVEKLFQEFDFLEDALHDVYDITQSA